MVGWGIECIRIQTNIVVALAIHCCKIKGTTSNIGEIRVIIVVYICV